MRSVVSITSQRRRLCSILLLAGCVNIVTRDLEGCDRELIIDLGIKRAVRYLELVNPVCAPDGMQLASTAIILDVILFFFVFAKGQLVSGELDYLPRTPSDVVSALV